MTQKTKAIILIVIILVATVVAGVYYVRINKAEVKVTQQTASQNKSQDDKKPVSQNKEEVAQKQLPKEVKGKIVGMSATSIIIDQSTGALTVTFDLNKTPVFKGANKVKTTALDLKAGIEVSATIDQATNGATEIIIQ